MFRTDDGVALAYDVRGDGLPLVLVNGLPDTKDGWNSVAGALAPYFRVVTYNLRNQGMVEEGGTGYQTERHVRDFTQLLAHLRIGRFVGVGLSMGARILVDFAAAHPDQALRLDLDRRQQREIGAALSRDLQLMAARARDIAAR